MIGKNGMSSDSEKAGSAFGHLIGKDGTSSDSEKASSLWVFDWRKWNVV